MVGNLKTLYPFIGLDKEIKGLDNEIIYLLTFSFFVWNIWFFSMIKKWYRVFWKEIKVGRGNLSLTHLFFDDDPITREVNAENCNCINYVLHKFCNILGQNIYRGKWIILFKECYLKGKKNSLSISYEFQT